MADLEAGGLLEYIDLETMYVKHVEANFDLEAIKNSGLNFAYDAMYGAGQDVMKRILPDCTFLHCEHNPTFYGQAPEPIAKNLVEFSELIKSKGNISAGLATDGDADRIGLYNSKGEFVDSHHILLLLMLCLIYFFVIFVELIFFYFKNHVYKKYYWCAYNKTFFLIILRA